MSFIRSRGVSTIQGFIMYRMNGDSIWTSVSGRYRACVRNSGVFVKRGSTVLASDDAAALLCKHHENGSEYATKVCVFA